MDAQVTSTGRGAPAFEDIPSQVPFPKRREDKDSRRGTPRSTSSAGSKGKTERPSDTTKKAQWWPPFEW